MVNLAQPLPDFRQRFFYGPKGADMRHPALGYTGKWLRGMVFFKRWSVWGTGVFHEEFLKGGVCG
jgi:hypothetical protein